MTFDPNPVHRRLLVPWYDADAACWLMVLGLSPAFLFGLLGLTLASATPEGQRCIAVPLLLVVLSGLVMGANLGRLLRRVIQRLTH